MIARPRRSAALRSGLTPLLDTLFILLFSLLALSDMRRSEPPEEVRVELPGVEAGGDATPSTGPAVRLSIDAQGGVALSETGTAIRDRAELDTHLAAALTDAVPEEVLVEIRADRAAPHGVAVELLQHLRLAGFVRVEILATGTAVEGVPFGGAPR